MTILHLRFNGNKDLEHRKFVETLPSIPIDKRAELFQTYRKKGLTYAARVSVPFIVDTLEGTHYGKAGDYLAVGIEGEMYPIDAEIFDKTYEEVI